MNHQKIYELIIKSAISKDRIKHNENYYEEHHILPKCLGGVDVENNLVLLTAKEHFICHKLLTYIYKGNRKIACAFHYMAFSKKYGKIVSGRDYQYARELISFTPISLETKIKKNKSLKGRIFSKETINKMRIAQSGKNNPMYGKKQSEETKEKRAKKLRGRKRSEESKKRMREAALKRTKIQIPWNKGLKKETDERVRKNGQSSGISRVGMPCSELKKEKLRNHTHTEKTKIKMQKSQSKRRILEKIIR
jgi:hypothetical protein